MTTSLFATLPFLIGLVVTFSPSLKALDPEMKPVMDPSKFFFHLLNVGTPRGAVAGTVAAEALLTAPVLAGVGAGEGRSSASAPPNPSPNNEKVERGLAFSMASAAALASRAFRSRVKVIVAPGCAPAMSLIAASTLALLTAGSALKKYRLPELVATTEPS